MSVRWCFAGVHVDVWACVCTCECGCVCISTKTKCSFIYLKGRVISHPWSRILPVFLMGSTNTLLILNEIRVTYDLPHLGGSPLQRLRISRLVVMVLNYLSSLSPTLPYLYCQSLNYSPSLHTPCLCENCLYSTPCLEYFLYWLDNADGFRK